MKSTEIKVEVKEDYIRKICRVSKPEDSLSELIWNSLDADSDEVKVNLTVDDLNNITKIIITDNGHGISYEQSLEVFKNLGNSWKKNTDETIGKKRKLHGKAGQGRFKAFSLGSKIKWESIYQNNGSKFKTIISGDNSNISKFKISNPLEIEHIKTGVSVEIENITQIGQSIHKDKTKDILTQNFSMYLRKYKDINLFFQEERINLYDSINNETQIDIPYSHDGKDKLIYLSIVEWNKKRPNNIVFSTTEDFPKFEIETKLKTLGLGFTAYANCAYFNENDIIVSEEFNVIENLTKKHIKEFFSNKSFENIKITIKEWKEDDIYPYKEEPKDNLEEVKRKIFDICAVNLNDFSPGFNNSSKKAKKASLEILKVAVNSEPQYIQKIFNEVLNLPESRIKEFSELIEKTSLNSILNLSKQITSRIDFISGLESIVFEKDFKKFLKERMHLHKIIENNTWIFGEEFNLTASDKSLTVVLKEHLKMQRGEEIEVDKQVLRGDGSKGIIDLMLTKRIHSSDEKKREHLIIELKRPTVKIGDKEMIQIEDYANAVADDERFKNLETKWHFWAVSNDIQEKVIKKTRQNNREKGVYYQSEEANITIWVKTWSEIIDNCKSKIAFYKKALEYNPDTTAGLKYLNENFGHLLPNQIKEATIIETQNLQADFIA
jgi:hypothetical protein